MRIEDRSATRVGPPDLEPARPGERIELIDILRGFAVFGILLVNMPLFFAPIYLQLVRLSWWDGPADQIAETLILFFGQGKFYSLFSLLFGVGLAIQMDRARRRTTGVTAFLCRRIGWLLVIGLVHAFLIWMGDILVMYAVLGLALVLIVSAAPGVSTRTLWIWSAILIVTPLVLMTGLTLLLGVLQRIPEMATELQASLAENESSLIAAAEEARQVYSAGSLPEILAVRAREVLQIYSFSLFFAPNVLGLFVAGFALGRARFFDNVATHVGTIRRLIPWFFGVGIVANAVMVAIVPFVDPSVPSMPTVVQQAAFTLGAPALCCFYVSGIVLLVQNERWHRRLAPLGCVGRMALTNYLMHSIVFTTLANSYGLGLYGTVSTAASIPMTAVFFLLQIPISVWWLRRFRFGPMEWVWRSLTYAQAQPMRLPGTSHGH